MANVGTSLTTAFDFVWARFRSRLVGLTDDEYRWEPTAGAWTVRAGPDGTFVLDGGRPTDPTPDPAPITTIAWRIGHVGQLALGGFAQRRFAESGGPAPDALLPDTAAAVDRFLETNYRAWRDPMSRLREDGWWAALGPAWGPYSTDTTVDLALHVLDELVHHGAEIGLLRDLYRVRGTLNGSTGRG